MTAVMVVDVQCTNSSRLLPDTTLNFIKTHPLMNNAVPATGGAPLLLHTSFKSVLTLCLYFSVSVPFSPSLSLFLYLSLSLSQSLSSPLRPPPPPPISLCWFIVLLSFIYKKISSCLYSLPVCSYTSSFLSYLLVSFPQRTCITPAFMNKQTKSPGIENTETTKAKAHASASKEKKERERDDQTEQNKWNRQSVSSQTIESIE